ncbi:MAG: nuclear transport factor 2 family protein [Bacteroidota bacterium]
MKYLTAFLVLALAITDQALAQTEPTKTIALYASAWGEPDENKRRELLEASFAEGGEYSDPTVWVEGREALVQHIGGFLTQNPGAKVHLLKPAEFHHEKYGRFDWIMQMADGTVVIIGMDFVAFDDEGMIEQITGFF